MLGGVRGLEEEERTFRIAKLKPGVMSAVVFALAQGGDAKVLARMKWVFRGLGVAMVPLTASMPQVQ
jgi:hypothetical protein